MATSEYSGIVPFVMHQSVAAGARWSGTFEHHLFSLTVAGGADYLWPDGRSGRVETGDFLYFAPGAWQDWTPVSPDGWTVYYLIADLPPHLPELLPDDNVTRGIGQIRLRAADAETVRGTFSEMLAWHNRHSYLTERLIANKLEYILLLIRHHYPAKSEDARVEKARHYLHDRIRQTTTLDDIARAAGLSKPRLCALFKEALAVSPMQYLENLRLERAAQMLRFSTLDLDAVAASLTYYDRKYFDKRFKRRWQMTPRQYRRQRA